MGDGSKMVVGLVAVGVIFFGGVGYVLSGNSGDQEFQKALESMKQVKTFRGMYSTSVSSGSHSERLWEVDCNRGFVHRQSRDSQTGADTPSEMKEEELLVGLDRYTRQGDGEWQRSGDKHVLYSGQWYCDNLAQGTIRDLLPDVRAMLRSAMIGKGDKKTVNGVRCQDWTFAMQAATSGLKGSVCIGLDDHLPYEMITDSGGHYSYSDYNRPVEVDVPEAFLQSASSTGGSN